MKYFVHFDERHQYGLRPCRLYPLDNRIPDSHTLRILFWNIPHVIQEIV